jgi:carboxymethylenebutenolidase
MRIELPGGTPAELVVPDGPAPTRGLVLLPDIMGLRPLFDDHVERVATATGWAVCAPELWPGRESLTLEERLAAAGTLRDESVLADAIEAAEATGAGTVAVTGFCIGGMYATKATGTGRFHRGVSFYGMIRVPEAWRSEHQGEPLAARARPEACPLLAVIGTEDVWTPAEDVDALEARGVTVVRYEGAEHGFVHDPSRPAHRPAEAADAWRRALEFLAG